MQLDIPLENFMDGLPAPLLYKNLQGQTLGCNAAFERMFGLSRESLHGRPLAEATTPELAAALQQGDEWVLASGESCTHPAQVRLADGTVRSVLVDTSAVHGADGAVAGVICLILDATELQLAREELHLKNRAMDCSVSAIAISDVNGVFTFANEAFERLTGVPKEMVVGRSFTEVARDVPRAEAIVQTIRDTGAWEGELEARRLDGSVYWNYMVCSAIRDDRGKLTGMLASCQDITERKRAQEALRESERQYRELVENANSIILRIDRQGRITFSNRFAQEFFGYGEDEILGRPALGTIIPTQNSAGTNLEHFWNKLLDEPERFANSENENMTRDGRRVWVSWTNRVLLDDAGDFAELLSVGNDITARKEIEQRLRISEAAIESSMTAIGIADLDGIIQYVNPAHLHLWGSGAAEDAVGRHISTFTSSEAAEKIIRAVRQQGSWRGEIPALRQDGSDFVVEISANVVRNEQDQPICMMASFLDITGRKEAADELRKFKAISDQANYGSVIVNSGEGTIAYCNDTFSRMHGYEPGELLGQPIHVLYEHGPESLGPLRDRLLAEGQLLAEHVLRRRKDGSLFPALLNVSLIHAGDGSMILSATVVDVTELAEAVGKLAAERERLAVTLRSISDGVIATDIDGRVTLMSAEAERLTGWCREEALGRPADAVYHTRNQRNTGLDASQDGARRHPVALVLASGQPQDPSEGMVLVARDGLELQVADSAAPISAATGEMIGVVLVFRDITEQQRLREAVYQAHRLESLGLLAGGIAHDFNNLLTSLLGQIGLARGEATGLPAAISELDAAEKVALQARHLSQQLLTFARGGAPVKRPANLSELIADAVGFALSGSNVAAEISVPADLWMLEADEGQITQVLSNLLINAVQAMPDGGKVQVSAANVTLEGGSQVPLPPGDYVEVTVTDAGPGIPLEILDKVFDPYFSTKPSGSGLGLTIVYSIVHKHNGHVTLQNAPTGKGVSFRFYLPARPDLAPPRQLQVGQSTPGFGKILVMDDDPFICKVVGAMLRQLGYEAEVVQTSDEAVQKVTAALDAPHRAVILDLTIKGGEGGVATLGKLRQLQPGIRALACSGYCDSDVMANYADYGFDGIVTKPYQLQDLAQGLARIVEDDHASSAGGAVEASPSSTSS